MVVTENTVPGVQEKGLVTFGGNFVSMHSRNVRIQNKTIAAPLVLVVRYFAGPPRGPDSFCAQSRLRKAGKFPTLNLRADDSSRPSVTAESQIAPLPSNDWRKIYALRVFQYN